jgi:hypothetical protein
MPENSAGENRPTPGDGGRAPRKRSPLLLTVLAVLFVLVPALFWHQTWFGRPLTNQEIEKQLGDREHPRKAQHALSQIADRILKGDETVRPVYPRVASLASHPDDNIRATAAWVMGQDNRALEFHQALLKLLRDPQVMVRRNAALSLVRFQDASGRAEIKGMLTPYGVRSGAGGTLSIQLAAGHPVGRGTLLARVKQDGGAESEVRSPFAGRVDRALAADGSRVAAQQEVILVSPDPSQVWEALRGLYLVGQSEDLPAVESYARPQANTTDQIRRQAVQTAQSIRARWEHETTR